MSGIDKKSDRINIKHGPAPLASTTSTDDVTHGDVTHGDVTHLRYQFTIFSVDRCPTITEKYPKNVKVFLMV